MIRLLIFCGVFLTVSSICTLHVAQAESTDPSEVNALRAIMLSLIDPMGNLRSWVHGDPCTSNWTGVFCSASNDKFLHIQSLHLLNMNLSGRLVPELGLLPNLEILDFMWNEITGTIPKEIGKITSLKLLLLSGNNLTGSLPEEIGYLRKLDRLQIDQNKISGPIPKSFANLIRIKHLHLNNNSLSGQIPSELSRLPHLYHLLIDNNNLSGHLPPELASLPLLKILQLDNNNFSGNFIPASYSSLTTLVKLSLRNCSLQGTVPDLSRMSQLGYLDLSWNQLKGFIPSDLSKNITTIDVSNNFLSGTIPSTFSELPKLQKLSLANNLLVGSVASSIWENMTLSANATLILDFQNNSLTDMSDDYNPPANVTVLLYGNPVCANPVRFNAVRFCQPKIIGQFSGSSVNSEKDCKACPVNSTYEHNPSAPNRCLCSIPLGVGFRMKSPGISDFRPYIKDFEIHLASLLHLLPYQLHIDSYIWESGPRLNMQLKLFPSNSSMFNRTEVFRLSDILASWKITLSDVYGPYELLNFSGPGASAERTSIKMNGVKCFTFEEMVIATRNFSNSTQVGHGGFGKVYKGTLDDGAVVAIKRAQVGSLQGSKEFLTEIELLSRLHHRNLVSLVGYCNEKDEQMLVYEFMPNGTLRDHLSGKYKEPLCFSKRLHIALGSSRGILYLHSEADPPIFHRDIKASNILLDFKFVAKVADFGLSRLAPVLDSDGIMPVYVSTLVKGTPGYLDPEYILTHKLTDKSDVYSLGVVFLELLTGLQPISHGKNIVREVRNACQSGLTFSLIDERMGSYPSDCTEKFVSLAVRCCSDETDARPSMAEVVSELEEIWRMMTEDEISETRVIDSSKLVSSSFVSSESSSGVQNVSNEIPDLVAR